MLKAFVKSLDDVEEQYRDLYVASGDGFALQVEGIRQHPEVTGLATSLERQKTRYTTLNTELTTLKERTADVPENFDADLYERAVANGVAGPGGKLPNEDEVRRESAEAATRRAEAGFAKERDKLTDKVGRLTTRVERDTRNSALNAALDAVKVTDPAYRAGAAAILSGSIKVIEDDNGDFVAVAHDKDLGDIPVAEHVKAWAGTDQGKAYVGARESEGGGANGSGSGGNGDVSSKNPWAKGDSFNVTAQAQLRRENPTLAAKFQREAGVVPS